MAPGSHVAILEKLLPLEQVATRTWLEAQGLRRHALDNLVKSRQLLLLTKGVYARPQLPVSWQGVAASMPRLMASPVVVGGLTSLELQGFSHYLPMGQTQEVHLWAPTACPGWLERVFETLPRRLRWHTGIWLWKNQWPSKPELKDFLWHDRMTLQLSAPEQAWLELLATVPKDVSLEHADQILQGLTALSPHKLTQLLGDCRSVKVKRLFFWLADRQRHAWRRSLEPKSFMLGNGKRVLVHGGKLDPTYLITVPAELMHEL